MKITSVKGTNDYLPNEVEIRDYLQNEILKVYVENGFEHITTPVIEDIENLDKSDGGENLNLIFKIMKRGDKLDKALASGVTSQNENVLADMGLRYDLTLPLSRYFANNKDKLTLPMKCIQMDRVYRAERPQKGRLREFVQCDIDIIGSDSRDSEVELILITTKALKAIGMKNFKVKVNDRRLLRAFLMDCGFEESQLDSVCITFDKMDKVGLEGVNAEPRKAIIFQRFTAHGAAVQHQLYTGGAGVDLHVGLAPLASGPAPAGHGIRHLPRTGAVAVSGMVDRADGDIGAVVGLQRHAGIKGFAQRFAGQVDASRTRRHPARTAIERFGVVGVLP